MSTGQKRLFCVCTLVLQLNLATAAVAAGCPMNPFTGRPRCNETCSKPPQIPFGGEFKCKVGYNAELFDFRSKYEFERAKQIISPNPQLCKVPVLSAISLHPLPYSRNSGFSPALNITFNVPLIGQKNKPELKAVILEFKSPLFTNTADKRFTDQAYSYNNDGIINRLFDFSSYQPDSYDLKNSIKIDYQCLYGLDDCHSGEKVYSITLTSLLSTMTNLNENFFTCSGDTCYTCSMTYTFSVYTIRYKDWNNHQEAAFNRDFEKWKMTIATALYPSPTDIFVLLEPRSIYNAYSISLISNGYVGRSKETTETNCTFKDVPPGTYNVQVVAKKSSVETDIFTTYHTIMVNGTGGEKDEEQPIITALAATILGVSLGIFFVVIIAWFRCKKSKTLSKGRQIEQPACIICSNGDHASVKMSQGMYNALHNLGIDNVHCPENFERISNLLDNAAPNATLIILFPVEHKDFQFQISKDVEYEQTVEYLLKRYRKLNILLVYFPYEKNAKSVRWKMLQNGKRICLMIDYEKMIKLLKVKNVCRKTITEVKSDLTTATEEARQVLLRYNETPPFTFPGEENKRYKLHRLPHNGDCPIHHPHNQKMFYLDNEDVNGMNNDLTNLDLYENRPQFKPPSPLPSIDDRNDSETFNTDSSGYITSRIPSSSDENLQKRLEDDISLFNEICEINKQILPENGVEIVPLRIVSKQSFSDDETESEKDPMLGICFPPFTGPDHSSKIDNNTCLLEEDSESGDDRIFDINFRKVAPSHL